MMWITLILGISLIISIIIFNNYRRQVKKLSRQLLFIKENKTNLKLITDINFKEIKLLEKNINELIEKYLEIEIQFIRSDDISKSTITNISHDIRTPLTSLDGYFQLLLECNDDSEKKRKYIKIIEDRIKNLREMLEELFTYSKLQEKDYNIELERVDINKILIDTVFSFYDVLESKNIQPQINIVEDKIWVIANESALIRVFQNILKNILIHGIENVKIISECIDNKVKITIANKSKSNEEINLSCIFDRFYKVDKSRSNNSTGLGLCISKELINSMNGKISAVLKDDWFEINIYLMKKI